MSHDHDFRLGQAAQNRATQTRSFVSGTDLRSVGGGRSVGGRRQGGGPVQRGRVILVLSSTLAPAMTSGMVSRGTFREPCDGTRSQRDQVARRPSTTWGSDTVKVMGSCKVLGVRSSGFAKLQGKATLTRYATSASVFMKAWVCVGRPGPQCAVTFAPLAGAMRCPCSTWGNANNSINPAAGRNAPAESPRRALARRGLCWALALQIMRTDETTYWRVMLTLVATASVSACVTHGAMKSSFDASVAQIGYLKARVDALYQAEQANDRRSWY